MGEYVKTLDLWIHGTGQSCVSFPNKLAWVFSKPQNYVTAASRGSFTPEMVLLISTEDLNQLVGELGYLLHLGWKNCYSSCSGVWKTSLSEVKREKRLLHLRGEVEGARCFEVRDAVTDVWLTKPGPGLCVGAFVCAKFADLVINYLGQNSTLSNKSLTIFFLDRCFLSGGGAEQEPIPSAYGWRRRTPLDPLEVQFLAQGYVGSVLAPLLPPANLQNN